MENLDPNWLGNSEEDIYKENILDHFKNPHNHGELDNCSFAHIGLNPVCGDTIKLFVKLDKNSKVNNVKFKGHGCAISVASASMLTDYIKCKTLDEIKNITRDNVLEMLGIKLGVVRIKCGLLCLNTLFKGIEIMEEENEIRN